MAPHPPSRWRVFVAAVLMFFAGCALPAACSPGNPAATAEAATTSSCTPRTAGDVYGMFEGLNNQTWSGGDQGASYRARNGAVYWLWGDTILGAEDQLTGAYEPGMRMISNSVLVQRGCALTRATSTETAVPDRPDGERYWAQDAFETGDGYLYVTMQRVRNLDGGGFKPTGTEIARFQLGYGDQLTFVDKLPTPTAGPEDADVQWGGTVVTAGGTVYVYGYRWINDPYAPHRTYLAKVPAVQLADVAAWRYWTGDTWSADKTAAEPILKTQLSSAAIINGTWVLLHKPWNGWGSEVRAETGPSAKGPFTSRVVFDSPAGTTPAGLHYETYCPQLHTALPMAGGKTLIGISWNGPGHPQDADLYKLRFSEVTLP
ncbi:MAG TPA: DUF4185 domain-containing protein [Kribbellaceae bacterium]|jgi:hypothetical protein